VQPYAQLANYGLGRSPDNRFWPIAVEGSVPRHVCSWRKLTQHQQSIRWSTTETCSARPAAPQEHRLRAAHALSPRIAATAASVTLRVAAVSPRCMQRRIGGDLLDRPHQPVRGRAFAEMIEHHRQHFVVGAFDCSGRRRAVIRPSGISWFRPTRLPRGPSPHLG
jgi:hypothetical protein